MRRFTLLVVTLPALLVLPALAQNPQPQPVQPPVPGKITGGATGITVNGKPVARQGDAVSGDDGSTTVVREGATGVFFNGRPAATVGSGTGCGGTVTGGASGVFINGRPLARQGDSVTGCPPR